MSDESKALITLLTPRIDNLDPYMSKCAFKTLIQHTETSCTSKEARAQSRLGMAAEVLHLLFTHYARSYEYEFYDVHANTAPNQPTIPSLLDKLRTSNNTCTIPVFVQTADRDQMFWASYEVMALNIYAVHSVPLERAVPYTNMLDVFQTEMWVAIFIFYLIVRLFRDILPDLIKCKFDVTVNKSHFTWLALISGVFFGLYRTGIMAKLIVSEHAALFVDMDGLIRTIVDKNYKLLVVNGASVQSMLLNASAFSTLRNALQLTNTQSSPHITYLNSYTDLWIELRKCNKNGNLFISFDDELTILEQAAEAEYLRFSIVQVKARAVELPNTPVESIRFYCNPNTNPKFLADLNKMLLERRDEIAAIHEHYHSKLSEIYQKRKRRLYNRYLRSISFADFAGDYLFLVIGAVIAATVMLFEKCLFCCMQRTRNDEPHNETVFEMSAQNQPNPCTTSTRNDTVFEMSAQNQPNPCTTSTRNDTVFEMSAQNQPNPCTTSTRNDTVFEMSAQNQPNPCTTSTCND